MPGDAMFRGAIVGDLNATGAFIMSIGWSNDSLGWFGLGLVIWGLHFVLWSHWRKNDDR